MKAALLAAAAFGVGRRPRARGRHDHRQRSLGTGAALVRALSIALLSCPPLLSSILLVWAAVVTGVLLPASGIRLRRGGHHVGRAGRRPRRHLALPTLALALPLAAVIERVAAQAVGEALAEPSIVAARARGVTERATSAGAAPRAAPRGGPILAVAGTIAGTLLSGSVAVELVTSWPGLGRLTFDCSTARDADLAAGCAVAAALGLGLAVLAADSALAAVDLACRTAWADAAGAKTLGRVIVGVGGGRGARPWLAPYDATRQFTDSTYVLLTWVHACSPTHGGAVRPFFHPAVLVYSLRRQFREDDARLVTLTWFTGAHVFGTPEGGPPFLLMGGGRVGTRSLQPPARGGTAFPRARRGVGGAQPDCRRRRRPACRQPRRTRRCGAAARHRRRDRAAGAGTCCSALALVLPANLDVGALFVLMAASFGLIGWPVAARGVRAIAARERARDYVRAAEAAGASSWRSWSGTCCRPRRGSSARRPCCCCCRRRAGDDVVCGARLPGPCARLGHAAAGRLEPRGPRRRHVAAAAGLRARLARPRRHAGAPCRRPTGAEPPRRSARVREDDACGTFACVDTARAVAYSRPRPAYYACLVYNSCRHLRVELASR